MWTFLFNLKEQFNLDKINKAVVDKVVLDYVSGLSL